jgi:hypothetical protein
MRAARVIAPAPDVETARLRRRGLWLEYASLAWMTAEATVGIMAGITASSIALTGFGLDSVIELLAAAAVVWQLCPAARGHKHRSTHRAHGHLPAWPPGAATPAGMGSEVVVEGDLTSDDDLVSRHAALEEVGQLLDVL